MLFVPWILIGCALASMWVWRYASISLLAEQPVPDKMLMAYQLPGSLDSFGLGMLGAALYVHRERLRLHRISPARLSAIAVCSLAVMVSAIFWMHIHHMDYWEHSLIFYTWTTIFSMAVVALLLAGMGGCRLAGILFANRFMVFFGVVSYSVYLWHFPVMEWLMHSSLITGLEGYRLPRLLGLASILTLLAASFSYVLVERPFMRLRRTASP